MTEDDQTSSFASPKPLALVADDDGDLLDTLASVLEAAGYEVIAAEDGSELVDRHLHFSARQGVDVVVTDIEMPRVGGLEAAREIRDSSPELGIVVITALPGPGLLEEAARDAGADVVLTKPFDMVEFKKAVEYATRLQVNRRKTLSLDGTPTKTETQ